MLFFSNDLIPLQRCSAPEFWRFLMRLLRSIHRTSDAILREGSDLISNGELWRQTPKPPLSPLLLIQNHPPTKIHLRLYNRRTRDGSGFCVNELKEIQDNIRSRRNKIFLHMEEVLRLRIQQRLKCTELGTLKEEQENELPNFPSFIPFLPPLLELKLGLGGTSYADFIPSVHLPMQLSDVDPIVASFSGGAVGVISALMVVGINNVKQQEHKRCKYCLGTGYLACARCSSTGSLVLIDPVATSNVVDAPLSAPKTEMCSTCSGSGKVMCPTCLCTGMAMASEHDPRIDPFD